MKTNINRLRKDFGWTYCFGETVFEFDRRGFMLMTPGQPGGLWAFVRPRGFRVKGKHNYFVFASPGAVFSAITAEFLVCEEYLRSSAYSGDETNYNRVRENYRTRTHLRRLARLDRMANKAIFNR